MLIVFKGDDDKVQLIIYIQSISLDVRVQLYFESFIITETGIQF